MLAVWLVVLFGVNGIANGIGDNYRQDLNLPDVESRDGFDLLNAKFGGQGTGFTGTIVFEADQGVDDASVQAAMSKLFDTVAAQDAVSRVVSPYEPGGERQVSKTGRSPTPTWSSPAGATPTSRRSLTFVS
ncbi:MAG: hypothetical protein R2701_03670 [Acidimicrobiales bacterium]